MVLCVVCILYTAACSQLWAIFLLTPKFLLLRCRSTSIFMLFTMQHSKDFVSSGVDYTKLPERGIIGFMSLQPALETMLGTVNGSCS